MTLDRIVPALVIGCATGAATLIGGQLALRLHRRIHWLMAFGGGAVIGVALMDLLPEAITLAGRQGSALDVTSLTAAGFMAYVMISQITTRLEGRTGPIAAHIAPASLVIHSLMDGLGIGLAFNLSSSAGLVLAVAVLAHDLMDGANTVTLGLAGGLRRKPALGWLWLDAAAPLMGIGLSTMLINPSPRLLADLLAVFAGLFLYIGAVELLPRSRGGEHGGAVVFATLLGAMLIYLVVRCSG